MWHLRRSLPSLRWSQVSDAEFLRCVGSVGDVGVKDAEAKDDTATGVSEDLWFYAEQHVEELMEFALRARAHAPHAYSILFRTQAPNHPIFPQLPGQTFMPSTSSQPAALWQSNLLVKGSRPAGSVKSNAADYTAHTAHTVQAVQYDIQLGHRSMDVSSKRGFLHLLSRLPDWCLANPSLGLSNLSMPLGYCSLVLNVTNRM